MNGITVIDDYGHHPVEIAAVLKAARQACDGRVQLTKWGDVEVDGDGRTSHDRIFAAGDITLGPSSIIEAVANARKAAATMHHALTA